MCDKQNEVAERIRPGKDYFLKNTTNVSATSEDEYTNEQPMKKTGPPCTATLLQQNTKFAKRKIRWQASHMTIESFRVTFE